MLKKLESYFEFSYLGTNWRTEVLAGFTTFLTMAYIVLVNPEILAYAGVPLQAATAAKARGVYKGRSRRVVRSHKTTTAKTSNVLPANNAVVKSASTARARTSASPE